MGANDLTKAEAEYRHAVRRAGQRYPHFLDSAWLIRSVRRLIRGSDSLCLCHDSKRKSHHLVVIDETPILAVYDRFRHEVITVLPSHKVWSYALTTGQLARLREMTEGCKWT